MSKFVALKNSSKERKKWFCSFGIASNGGHKNLKSRSVLPAEGTGRGKRTRTLRVYEARGTSGQACWGLDIKVRKGLASAENDSRRGGPADDKTIRLYRSDVRFSRTVQRPCHRRQQRREPSWLSYRLLVVSHTWAGRC